MNENIKELIKLSVALIISSRNDSKDRYTSSVAVDYNLIIDIDCAIAQALDLEIDTIGYEDIPAILDRLESI